MMINKNADRFNRETSQYIVAYLDLLGVTDRIGRDAGYQRIAMNKLHNLYTFTMDLASKIAIEGYQDIQFKIFSDNIIIAKKLSEQSDRRLLDIKCLLNCASHFQCLSVGDGVGWLVRGGITVGELFLDETMVWGKALLKAYNLEYSSGKSNVQYSNERGNRVLNSIFFRLAVMVTMTVGKNKKIINPFFYEYYHKKISEGKTKRQALKCVQRRLVNIIWSMMTYKKEYINPPTEDFPQPVEVKST